jgi:Protein of unknown function (DUF3575)
MKNLWCVLLMLSSQISWTQNENELDLKTKMVKVGLLTNKLYDIDFGDVIKTGGFAVSVDYQTKKYSSFGIEIEKISGNNTYLSQYQNTYISVEPNIKLYTKEKMKGFYIGFGANLTHVIERDFKTAYIDRYNNVGLNIKFGYQTVFDKKFVLCLHTGAGVLIERNFDYLYFNIPLGLQLGYVF